MLAGCVGMDVSQWAIDLKLTLADSDESHRPGDMLGLSIVACFGPGRWNVVNRFEQAPVVEPVHPLQGGGFNLSVKSSPLCSSHSCGRTITRVSEDGEKVMKEGVMLHPRLQAWDEASAYRRVKVITGRRQRRRWTAEEKALIHYLP
jgi:hypothetical protein